jgi:hypothetical protein
LHFGGGSRNIRTGFVRELGGGNSMEAIDPLVSVRVDAQQSRVSALRKFFDGKVVAWPTRSLPATNLETTLVRDEIA